MIVEPKQEPACEICRYWKLIWQYASEQEKRKFYTEMNKAYRGSMWSRLIRALDEAIKS